jgi:hypothetical protein
MAVKLRAACAGRCRDTGGSNPDKAGVPHPVAPQVWLGQVARLHLHRRPADPVVEGQDSCALTNRTSQQNPRDVLIRLNQIMRGWANFFKHAVCKHTLGNLAHFAWWRVIRWLRTLLRWRW